MTYLEFLDDVFSDFHFTQWWGSKQWDVVVSLNITMYHKVVFPGQLLDTRPWPQGIIRIEVIVFGLHRLTPLDWLDPNGGAPAMQWCILSRIRCTEKRIFCIRWCVSYEGICFKSYQIHRKAYILYRVCESECSLWLIAFKILQKDKQKWIQ